QNSERWAFFARRSGNEGGSSQDLHHFDSDQMAFFFPNHGWPGFTLDTGRSIVRAAGTQSRMKWHKWEDGIVVNVGLGLREAVNVVYGELEFCNGSCDAIAVETTQPLIRSTSRVMDRFAVLELNSAMRRGERSVDES